MANRGDRPPPPKAGLTSIQKLGKVPGGIRRDRQTQIRETIPVPQTDPPSRVNRVEEAVGKIRVQIMFWCARNFKKGSVGRAF